MIKEPEKKPLTSIINPDTYLAVKKNVPVLSEKFRRIFQHTSKQVIFKGVDILISILMHAKDKISSQLKQNIVY